MTAENLMMALARPKGPKNPFMYYPEEYEQHSEDSILDSSGKYDLTRFSNGEIRTIKQVLSIAQAKYPEKYRALGLANEAYVVVYKARYILLEMVVLMYGESNDPVEKIAAAFACTNQGASKRREAIRLFESADPNVRFWTLDKFASLFSASLYLKMAEIYEAEAKYDEAIRLIQKSIIRGGLYKPALQKRIAKCKAKKDCAKNQKAMARRKNEAAELFDRRVQEAARYFMKFAWEPRVPAP